MTNHEYAADALRRHEQAGKRLNAWDTISATQKRKWLAKVEIVIKAIREFPVGAIV